MVMYQSRCFIFRLGDVFQWILDLPAFAKEGSWGEWFIDWVIEFVGWDHLGWYCVLYPSWTTIPFLPVCRHRNWEKNNTSTSQKLAVIQQTSAKIGWKFSAVHLTHRSTREQKCVNSNPHPKLPTQALLLHKILSNPMEGHDHGMPDSHCWSLKK